ncbi:MAG: DUF1501 domain-containing protein [Planctomycetia bacterium]|nr:DUF1501 domain-containing protein [Planctomycetia bacterium]
MKRMIRREALLSLGQAGLGSLTLPWLLAAEKSIAQPARRPRAKSCLLIFLWGGPPQQDMWDLKPDAPSGIRSLFQPIASAVPGIDICDQMPQIARHTDKLALVRSMSHPSNDHEISIYRSLTGRVDESVVVPNHFRRRSHFPHVGAGVSRFSPAKILPTAVTLPGPVWFSGISFAGTHGGFLGQKYDPFEFQRAPRPDLKGPEELAADDGQGRRTDGRRRLLDEIESHDRLLQTQRDVRGFDDVQQRAFSLLASPEARRALELENEDVRRRESYGRHIYGESFLLAARLIEAGVRLVTVNWMHFPKQGGTINPWDNHGGSPLLDGLGGYALLTQPYCLPSLDQAFAALLADLAARGVLDETLVVLTGEFGRTPKINAQNGRDHWGPCYTTVLAGGGIRGGQVYGASDKDAAYPKSNPVAPEDILATIYDSLGISSDSEIHDSLGRPYALCLGRSVSELF